MWAAAWATHAPFSAADSAGSPEEHLHLLQRERARLLRRHVARTEVPPGLEPEPEPEPKPEPEPEPEPEP